MTTAVVNISGAIRSPTAILSVTNGSRLTDVTIPFGATPTFSFGFDKSTGNDFLLFTGASPSYSSHGRDSLADVA